MPLLKVAGNQFVPPILGTVTTHHEWPYVDEAAQDQIAAAGLNYTAMRLPCDWDDRPGHEVYQRAPGEPPSGPAKFDLTKFNPAFGVRLDAVLAHAESKGIYVNLGLRDGWCAVHVRDIDMPMEAGNNINGAALGSCADFQRAPDPWIVAEVKHVIGIAAKHTNMIWELGNEANRCSPSNEFIDGVHAAVREAEDVGHYPHHLWSPGTTEGSARGSSPDFVSMHGLPVAAEPSQPIEINEFSPQGQDEYLAHLAESRAQGVPAYHYWHDDNPNQATVRGAIRSKARPKEMSVESYHRATGKRPISPEALLGALAAGPEGFGAALKLDEVKPGATGEWDDPAWEAEWLDTLAKMGKVQPMQGCYDIPNLGAVAVAPRPPADQKTSDAVNVAIQRVTGCSIGSNCAISMGRNAWLLIVTAEIRKDPTMCAGVQTDGEGLVDQLCAGQIVPGTNRADRCQGHHSYTCNEGCTAGVVGWAPGSYTNRNGDTWVRP